MLTKIRLVFGWQVIIFFLLLEGITVPLVAMANGYIRQGFLLLSIFGFLVALFALCLLVGAIKSYLLKNSIKLFQVQAIAVKNIYIIPVIAGLLEMIMFMVQSELFRRGYHDYSAGFWSAFISVGVALVIYKLMEIWFDFAMKLVLSEQTTIIISFAWLDIFRLAILFGLYEMLVCPITGAWIPYFGGARIVVALLSGIIGGALGGALLVFVTQYIQWLRVNLLLK